MMSNDFLNADNNVLFEKTDEIIDIFVKAFKDLQVRILNVGRMREAINLAFMEMARRDCLEQYTNTRKDKMGEILNSLIDDEGSDGLKEVVGKAVRDDDVEMIRDNKKSKFFVEK